MSRRLNPRYQELHNPSKSSNHKQEVKSRCRNIQLGGYATVCNENNMKQSNNLHITRQMLQCQEPIWSLSKRWTCPSVNDPNRVAMLQWKMLSIPAMPQCKVVYPSRQLLKKIMLVYTSTNQSISSLTAKNDNTSTWSIRIRIPGLYECEWGGYAPV